MERLPVFDSSICYIKLFEILPGHTRELDDAVKHQF